MKGISHFISGVAAATFIERAVQMSSNEHSIILAIGGLFGILPDTLDFKFAKFMQSFDYEVDPHPEKMDPQQMAEVVAKAINESYENDTEVNLMLHSVKLSADLYRQYSVHFDNKNSEVVVEIGPVVNMSKLPYPGTEFQGKKVGRAKLNAHVLHSYDDKTYIDIFSGSDFSFRKLGNKVEALFIPWHRKWSHSLTLGIFFGALAYFIMYFLGNPDAWVYGTVVAGAFCVHVLEDQLGYMGSNLYWPISKERFNGLHFMRSADAWPNFVTVWISCLLILFNLNRFAAASERAFNMSWVEYFGYTFFVPILILFIIERIFRAIYRSEPAGEELQLMDADEKNKEIITENQDNVEQ
ncbi:MAG: metal-dependent hydrolase [Candidatus Muiribacteriota bacterium]